MLRHELRSIQNPDRRKLLQETLGLLEKSFGEELMSVVVFGSVARGEENPDSDTDLLVVARNLPKSLSGRMEMLVKILIGIKWTKTYEELESKGISTWIQFHPLTPDEAMLHRPIYLDIVEDGVILLDRGGFVESVLMGLKGRLSEMGARRIYLEDGSWSWDLKPKIRRGEVLEI